VLDGGCPVAKALLCLLYQLISQILTNTKPLLFAALDIGSQFLRTQKAWLPMG
jgi:hypothetical protein